MHILGMVGGDAEYDLESDEDLRKPLVNISWMEPMFRSVYVIEKVNNIHLR